MYCACPVHLEIQAVRIVSAFDGVVILILRACVRERRASTGSWAQNGPFLWRGNSLPSVSPSMSLHRSCRISSGPTHLIDPTRRCTPHCRSGGMRRRASRAIPRGDPAHTVGNTSGTTGKSMARGNQSDRSLGIGRQTNPRRGQLWVKSVLVPQHILLVPHCPSCSAVKDRTGEVEPMRYAASPTEKPGPCDSNGMQPSERHCMAADWRYLIQLPAFPYVCTLASSKVSVPSYLVAWKIGRGWEHQCIANATRICHVILQASHQ